MIPLRISLEGFLTYREKQSFDFSSAPLWMLYGSNGVGKSAVFDAITLVLFDKHRGSEQGIDRRESSKFVHLINHNSDRLKVEFEFMIGSAVYRVERMIPRRGRATKQASCLVDGHWYPEPDTDNEHGFRTWVEQTIALNYEAFTSAVLLRQGQSEKLLEAKADQRFEILTQLIDLNPYKQLFGQADAKRTEYDQELKTITRQLSQLKSVSKDDLDTAYEELKRLQEILTEIQEIIPDVSVLLRDSQNWEKWTEEHARKQQEKLELDQVLQARDQINADYRRFLELEKMLPVVDIVVRNREQLENSLQQLQDRLKKVFENYEDEASQIVSFKLLYTQFAHLELGNLPTLGAVINELQGWVNTEFTRTAKQLSDVRIMRDALPQLHDLAETREDLKNAIGSTSEAQSQLAVWKNAIEKIKKDLQVAEQVVLDATQVMTAKLDDLSSARTMLNDVRDRQKEFETVTGKETCDLCGQPITAEHILHEHERLDRLIIERQQVVSQLSRENDEYKRHLDMLSTEKKNQEQLLRDAENNERKCQSKLESYDIATGKDRANLDKIYRRLPTKYSTLVIPQPLDEIDWLSTTFPTKTDLRDLEEAQLSYELCEVQFNDVDNLQKYVGIFQQSAEDWLASIARISDENWHRNALHFDEEYLSACNLEHATLEGTPADYEKLQELSTQLTRLTTEINVLRNNMADVSNDAKRPSADIEREYKNLDEKRQRTDELRSVVQGRVHQMQNDFDARIKLNTDRQEAERLLRLYTRLATLLSAKADGLQLHLLRHAELSIVRIANQVLDRLSDGTLELKLKSTLGENGTSSKAFDLAVCDKRIGKNDIGVEFTSGSQRFRIAVSLALAIGQYASRESQRIESVIIDEGFGGLDKDGRDAMIDALDSLRQQLKRIVLVSHQEEFANIFSNKYKIWLDHSTSYVELD